MLDIAQKTHEFVAKLKPSPFKDILLNGEPADIESWTENYAILKHFYCDLGEVGEYFDDLKFTRDFQNFIANHFREGHNEKVYFFFRHPKVNPQGIAILYSESTQELEIIRS